MRDLADIVSHIKEKQCYKVRYRSQQKALNDLKRIKKTGVIVPSNAVAYLCESCRGWHLGHKRY